MDRYYYEDTKIKTDKKHKFIKMPYELITNKLYKGLSCAAKFLYSLMLDRNSLSQTKGWLDERKRVYIYFSIESIMEYLGCSKPTAIKTLKELEAVDLIEKKKQGQGKATIIYVKKVEEELMQQKQDDQEQKQEQKGTYKNKKVVFFYLSESKKFTLRSKKVVKQEVKKIAPSNTKNSYNNSSDLLSIYQRAKKRDREIGVEGYEQKLKENIEFDLLVNDFGHDKVQALVDIMMDVITTNKKEFVGIHTELFRSRIWKLRMNHIQYVLWSLQATTSKIKNIYAYLAKSLYQASTTEEYYFATLFNYNKRGECLDVYP